MRHPVIAALLAVLAVFGAASAAPAATISAVIDQGVRINLPAGTRDVMIGNAAIADVSIIDSRTAVIQGRTYGMTNLLVVDGRGRTLMNSTVVVGSPDVNRISVYRGPQSGGWGVNSAKVENYTCAGRCERTPMPGETDNDYSRYSGSFSSYASRAAEARRNTSGGQ